MSDLTKQARTYLPDTLENRLLLNDSTGEMYRVYIAAMVAFVEAVVASECKRIADEVEYRMTESDSFASRQAVRKYIEELRGEK